MRNLLFLAYYFPPSGGVLRLVKLAKYLPAFGWRPLVVCPRPRGIYRSDPGLLSELPACRLYRTLSLDPTFIFPPRADAATVSSRRNLIDRVNKFFVPDNKIGWIPFAISTGIKVSRLFPIDAVFSSAPPFSSHLAGVFLKKILRRPLICDFRDAWSQPNTLNLKLPAWHRTANGLLEKWAVGRSDMVTAINRPILEGLKGFDGRLNSKFQLMPQGFDPEDFSEPPDAAPDRKRFTIAYTGTLTPHRRLDVLARALRLISEQQPEVFSGISFTLAGVHRPEDLGPFLQAGLTRCLQAQGFVSHRHSLEILHQADALWMTVGRREGPTVSTSKIYEYLGARKPILASVPAGSPAADLVAETKSGFVFDPDDHVTLAQTITDLCRRKKYGGVIYSGDPHQVSKYDRREIARSFARHLDQLVKTRAGC
jgi:glycosyltransferase involved in cell wall biosynthesis